MGVVLLAALGLLVAGVFAVPSWRCELTGCEKPSRSKERPSGPATRTISPQAAATRGGYVALGDSYSAGVGVQTDGDGDDDGKGADEECLRHAAAFYHDVTRAFRFPGGSSFWACSGATTTEVLKGKDGRLPQTDRVSAKTSLVTLSIGGNDAGFTKVLTRCLAEVLMGSCRGQGDEIAERLDELAKSLPEVIGRITARAPNARVLVVGYPRMFSDDPKDGVATISEDDQRWLNERTREVDNVIKQSARNADRKLVKAGKRGSVEFIDAYNAFDGHETGTSQPYVNGLKFNLRALSAESRSFHPTEKGHRALARLVTKQIKEGPGRPFVVKS
ncbi:SGNH/GDSL hydrolase family protein [Streptomyces armeniacus]|uniref:SGNH/GDSL hydrolase family protein n=1 Tax=Streptomyces armeniacus TaxID=83291 RepID=UPI001C9A8AE3|nr:SGNH/GDSL hydrolase family protein [Streptomyces armeniacus]